MNRPKPTSASGHRHRHQQRSVSRRPQIMISNTGRKDMYSSRARTTSKRKRSKIDLLGIFRIFASIILLGSSALTFLVHSRASITNLLDSNRNYNAADPTMNEGQPLHVVPQYLKDTVLDDKKYLESPFGKVVKETRHKFQSLYGGEEVSRALLQKGVMTFKTSNPNANNGIGINALDFTAKRMQMAREEGREFTFGFAGYSVTAGRGNYFNQSFPFVMERHLKIPMKELGIQLKVINAGIGGVPSFPYGLCLDNFFGSQRPVDVITWDFAMNEAGDVVEGMEAYIRQVLAWHKQKDAPAPMLIVKDTHMATNRANLIHKYVEAGALLDPIILHTNLVTKPFLKLEEGSRPEGFQSWREFGAPQNAPGRSKHHPAKREHEFIGFLISMHFLDALELLVASDMGLYTLPDIPMTASLSLPAPIHWKESSISQLLYGTMNNEAWSVDRAACRTSFAPILQGDLREIVESKFVESVDMLLPKGLMMYHTAWVYDLGDAERKAKQRLVRYGGLGFMDSKRAFYGIHASGSISFFLENDKIHMQEETRKISTVIVCESNERRDPSACNLKDDASYIIGGVSADAVESIDATGFTYLGRNICVRILVPLEAKMSTRNHIMNATSTGASSEKVDGNGVSGFPLEISVTNPRILSKHQACCISHIIWI